MILETLPLEEIVSVGSARAGVCTLQIASGVRLPLHTTRAPQLAEMIGNFIRMVSRLKLYSMPQISLFLGKFFCHDNGKEGNTNLIIFPNRKRNCGCRQK